MVFYLAVFGTIAGFGLHFLIRRRLPGFELLGEGQASHSKEAVLYTAAIGLQIPVGLLVNYLSSR